MGLSEAGFGPVIPFYYNLFYLKPELGLRTTIFIAAAPIAGAFSGLIAYGVQLIKTDMDNWRILFLIEGLPTILMAFIVLFFLPSRVEITRLFNEDERLVAISRMNRESTREAIGYINWRHGLSALYDYKIWLIALIYQSNNVMLSSISNFLVPILEEMGYEGADAQLYSVWPYLCAGGFMIGLSIFSDRVQLRGPFITFSLTLSGVGYAMLLGLPVKALKARYGAIFLSVMGSYTAVPLSMVWVTSNAGSETKKAIGMALLNSIGHCMSVLGSYIYTDAEAPEYTRGLLLNSFFVTFIK